MACLVAESLGLVKLVLVEGEEPTSWGWASRVTGAGVSVDISTFNMSTAFDRSTSINSPDVVVSSYSSSAWCSGRGIFNQAGSCICMLALYLGLILVLPRRLRKASCLGTFSISELGFDQKHPDHCNSGGGE